MENKLSDYLKKIVSEETIKESIRNEAKEFLEKDFKDRVIEIWGYSLIDSYSKEENIKCLDDKIEFICNSNYSNEKKKFILNHFYEIDKIIAILKDYIKEQDEKKEKKENE